jgi:hypothetical protein
MMARNLAQSALSRPRNIGAILWAAVSRHHFFHALLFIVTYAGFTAYLKPHQPYHSGSLPVEFAAAITPDTTPTASRGLPPLVTAVSNTVAAPQNVATARPIEVTTYVPAPVSVDYTGRLPPVMQLQHTVEDDEHAENRLAAVRRLSEMATNADQSRAVLRVLQSAMTDADEGVAAAARAAYKDINARSQAPQ